MLGSVARASKRESERERARSWRRRMVAGGEVSDDMKIAAFPASRFIFSNLFC